jgi:hypothetical protein
MRGWNYRLANRELINKLRDHYGKLRTPTRWLHNLINGVLRQSLEKFVAGANAEEVAK